MAPKKMTRKMKMAMAPTKMAMALRYVQGKRQLMRAWIKKEKVGGFTGIRQKFMVEIFISIKLIRKAMKTGCHLHIHLHKKKTIFFCCKNSFFFYGIATSPDQNFE